MSAPSNLLTTPLHDLHIELGAKMVPFAGYDMPVQYPLGVLKEHLQTRQSAGLFDVSHMGQLRLSGEGVREALETLIPVDILGLQENKQRYGFFTLPNGGILDDLMITNCGDYLLLVVNAACKSQDIAHLQAHLPSHILLEELSDNALLALQGPKARAVLGRFAPAIAEMHFMDSAAHDIAGISCYVSCSGYTGEDGYEISVGNDHAVELARLLLAQPEVEAIGLGARDSLRLEAGLCLYGHDIDQNTTPITANIPWAIQKIRRPGGERVGGYPGADIIASEFKQGALQKRIMLKAQGKAPIREGAELANSEGRIIGRVTSGGYGPSIGGPVAMAYVDSAFLLTEQPLFALVRNKSLAVDIVTGGLLPSRYYRG